MFIVIHSKKFKQVHQHTCFDWMKKISTCIIRHTGTGDKVFLFRPEVRIFGSMWIKDKIKNQKDMFNFVVQKTLHSSWIWAVKWNWPQKNNSNSIVHEWNWPRNNNSNGKICSGPSNFYAAQKCHLKPPANNTEEKILYKRLDISSFRLEKVSPDYELWIIKKKNILIFKTFRYRTLV